LATLFKAHAHDEEIRKMNDVDTVFIQIQLPSGILCHTELGRDSRYGYDQTIEIFGELGKAISGGQKITAWEYWNKVRYFRIYNYFLSSRSLYHFL
jgi:predicted dehydrogenase